MEKDFPKRKCTRLKNYDYSAPGVYFITVCTKNRKQILSKIVGTDLPGGPINKLTAYGKVADKHLLCMKEFYPNIRTDTYVIMPNHVHLLIRITGTATRGGPPGTSVPTDSLIARFVGTFKRFCNRETGENIWQARSYDHIIRGEADYAKIYEYIETNVLRWEKDCFYSADE